MLTVRDLGVRYGDVVALQGLSFTVERGQVIGLVGGNGAGKTTALAAISGLVKNRAGSVELDGTDITPLAPDQIVERGLVQCFRKVDACSRS